MIALLILAVLVLGAFVAWEYWIEKRGRTPPLLPLGVFTLDHGRVSILCLAAVSHAKIAIREGCSLRFRPATTQPFNFIGFSGFMLLTTLYFQEYLELSLRDTAVSRGVFPARSEAETLRCRQQHFIPGPIR
jgi:hypothetical protein